MAAQRPSAMQPATEARAVGRRVPSESGSAAVEETDNATMLVRVTSSLAPFKFFNQICSAITWNWHCTL
jgi:hypothetical protein